MPRADFDPTYAEYVVQTFDNGTWVTTAGTSRLEWAKRELQELREEGVKARIHMDSYTRKEYLDSRVVMKFVEGIDIRENYNGTWAIYDDNIEHHFWNDFVDLEQALDHVFVPYAHGGYPMMFWIDGEIMCHKCAREWFLERRNGGLCYNVDAHTFIKGWSTSGTESCGESCGACGEYIVEPYCEECGDTENDLERREKIAFYNDSDGGFICSSCLAKEVVRGKLVKVGFQAYATSKDEKWARRYETLDAQHKRYRGWNEEHKEREQASCGA
jgi:hypothetical protein